MEKLFICKKLDSALGLISDLKAALAPRKRSQIMRPYVGGATKRSNMNDCDMKSVMWVELDTEERLTREGGRED